MGAVYEALDERLDTVVALKETLFTDERLRKQFEREARLLARMHHPALPRVSDHFSEGDGQFLVMQYIAGDDLDQMMKDKQGPFPPDQVLTWGDQLLDALDYLHTQEPQIIHRDIKPQNLKITARGQIILLDFGLAKGQSGGISVVTTSASIFGYTPNYAPLEQIQGLGTDARSDIYALSATLYHLMTGVKPPDALTRAAALVNGQPDPLTPANAISGNIGSEVASVLARGMSQNRDQRFATAAGMRAALHGSGEAATLAGRSEAATVILSTPATASESATRIDPNAKPTAMPGETTVVQTSVRDKRRVAPWAVAAAALILLGGVVVAYYGYQHGKNSADPAAPAANQEGAAATQPTQESQATTGAAIAPASTDANVDSPVQRSDSNPKRSESAAKPPQKTVELPAHATHPAVPAPPTAATSPTQQRPVAEPNVPVGDPQGTQDLEIFRRRRQGDVRIRTLPDGTKVMTAPDGTRSVILPDGTRKVLRAGPRPRRLP
jgi:serine/threonine protein kinase